MTAAYRPITGPGPVKAGEPAFVERTSVHECGRSRAPVLHVLTPDDADRQALLDEWVLRQRAAGLSEKTIRERLGIIGRLPNAATLTPVDVDRFLANPGMGEDQPGRPTTARSAPGPSGWSAPDDDRTTPPSSRPHPRSPRADHARSPTSTWPSC